MVAGCHDAAALETTEFVQPALLACDVAAFRVLEAEGVSFIGVAGHSLGEFAALVAAGVVRLGDALDLVVVRGAAMQRAGEERPGAMTALLGVGAEDATALCEEARRDEVLVVANENSPAQSVISGSVHSPLFSSYSASSGFSLTALARHSTPMHMVRTPSLM